MQKILKKGEGKDLIVKKHVLRIALQTKFGNLESSKISFLIKLSLKIYNIIPFGNNKIN